MHRWEDDKLDRAIEDAVEEASWFDILCELIAFLAIVYFGVHVLLWVIK